MLLSNRAVSARLMDEPGYHYKQASQSLSFEQLIKIKTDDPESVDEFLSPQRREALAQLFEWTGLMTCHVSDADIQGTSNHIEPDIAPITRVVTRLVATARVLEAPQHRTIEQNSQSTLADQETSATTVISGQLDARRPSPSTRRIGPRWS